MSSPTTESSVPFSWKALGLKSHYDAEELIILKSDSSALLPRDSTLRFEGPLPQGTSLLLKPRTAPNGLAFYEFYALSAGTYSLRASWLEESVSIQILPRESLGFTKEFGIFVSIAGVLVLFMAYRFLFPKISKVSP